MGWGKGDKWGSLFQPATSFTLLEHLISWCNIKVIKNPDHGKKTKLPVSSYFHSSFGRVILGYRERLL